MKSQSWSGLGDEDSGGASFVHYRLKARTDQSRSLGRHFWQECKLHDPTPRFVTQRREDLLGKIIVEPLGDTVGHAGGLRSKGSETDHCGPSVRKNRKILPNYTPSPCKN